MRSQKKFIIYIYIYIYYNNKKMPRGKKSPVKRKTRRVSPRRVKRKTSPRRVKRKTSPRRKTYRKRLNPPPKFDTNRELMERLDADREAVRQNRKRVEERREEIKRDFFGFDRASLDSSGKVSRSPPKFSGKVARYLTYEEISEFLKRHGKCIRDKVNKNLVRRPGDKISKPKYELTTDDMVELCNINKGDFNKLLQHLSLDITEHIFQSPGFHGAWWASASEHKRKWYQWDWNFICKYYGAL